MTLTNTRQHTEKKLLGMTQKLNRIELINMKQRETSDEKVNRSWEPKKGWHHEIFPTTAQQHQKIDYTTMEK